MDTTVEIVKTAAEAAREVAAETHATALQAARRKSTSARLAQARIDLSGPAASAVVPSVTDLRAGVRSLLREALRYASAGELDNAREAAEIAQTIAATLDMLAPTANQAANDAA